MALRSLRKLSYRLSPRFLVDSTACSSSTESLSYHSCASPYAQSTQHRDPKVPDGKARFQSRWFRSSALCQKDIEVEIQSMGESITEGTMAEILKKEGDAVEEDETIAQIETDKVTVDVKAPSAGKLSKLQVRC